MNALTLAGRGLAHHARAHAATLAGAALGCAVLVGALALGDSVRASLERAARARLGRVDLQLGNGERFFDAERLPRELAARVADVSLAAVLELPGVAATPDGARRADTLVVRGVDERFFALAGGDERPALAQADPRAPGAAWLSPELARRLDARVGDELVLRVPRPSATSRELALTSLEDAVKPVRVSVAGVLAPEAGGAFSPAAGAGPAANVFVAREWLARELGLAGRANRIYAATGASERRAALVAALRSSWELDDLGLKWTEVDGQRQLTSDQVFLADALVAALAPYDGPRLELFGYFVNALEHGERSTPYSTVLAVGGPQGPQSPQSPSGAPDSGWPAGLARDLGADEIALNGWTADDLAAGPGDTVTLRYFVLGEGRALEERTHAFRVREVLPMEGAGADPALAPDFPGLSEHENCRDWDPGLPLDLDAIRDQDEAYWDRWRGAPKAFVSLGTAEKLWGNRYGKRTAVRVPEASAGAFLDVLRRGLDPAALGLAPAPLSAEVEATSDFGGLFLGLSFFLIVSALLLTALFFAFSLERRAAELGVLRVAGFSRRAVAALYLGEAALLFVPAVVLGSALGLAYTRLLLSALERGWRGAVGRTELVYHVEPATLATGAAISFALALACVGWVLVRALRAPPLRLLQGGVRELEGAARARAGRVLSALGLLAFAGASGAVLGARGAQGEQAAGLAFLAGALALAGGLLSARVLLGRAQSARSLVGLGWSNAARRAGRSLTTVALVASAVFLLVVAGANRQGPAGAELGRDSGTGGFDFFGRTSLPVLHDLATAEGRAYYGLEEADLADVDWLALRARAGDEASCLNLDRPRSPRLLGVAPERLRGRFRFARTLTPCDDPWSLLSAELGPDVVPVVVDATSLTWTLHRKLGDELELLDGRGRPYRARVVATLEDSILQGDIVLSERAFTRLFPDEPGRRAFLVDAPAARAPELALRLTRALSDEGLVLEPSHERLDLLHGVQNTYLAIFQALGGLGLALGSVGLLALVLRHAVERQGELALLQALGFRRAQLAALFLAENGALVGLGLALGALGGAGVLAAQGWRQDAGDLARLALGLVLAGGAGCLWVWLGARLALRGELLATLQRE